MPTPKADESGLPTWIPSPLRTGIKVIGRTAATVQDVSENLGPLGFLQGQVSHATGGTVGHCGGGSVAGGITVDVTSCYVASANGDHGLEVSVGSGMSTGVGASGLIGITGSNASGFSDLNGPFAGWSGAVSDGWAGGGGAVSAGNNIVQVTGGWAPGYGMQGTPRGGSAAGVSWTVTFKSYL
jgi:hypothetical protein